MNRVGVPDPEHNAQRHARLIRWAEADRVKAVEEMASLDREGRQTYEILADRIREAAQADAERAQRAAARPHRYR
ncbi:hypothetical protein [Streptomyces sp. NPDC058108]|uniref:hypothetical protein n=1 Tax=Streptomyces sp. NPDC058108 TaxID=3346344 RepID=UPI0036E7DCAA